MTGAIFVRRAKRNIEKRLIMLLIIGCLLALSSLLFFLTVIAKHINSVEATSKENRIDINMSALDLLNGFSAVFRAFMAFH